MDIAAALSGLRLASELVTKVREALRSKDVNREEVAQSVVEAQGLIADARVALADAQEEIAGYRKQVADLRDVKENFEFRDNMCWRKGTNEGPYCPTCLQADGKAVRLIDYDDHYHCPVQNVSFTTHEQRRGQALYLPPRDYDAY